VTRSSVSSSRSAASSKRWTHQQKRRALPGVFFARWSAASGLRSGSARASGAPPRPAGPYANVPRRRPAAAPSSFTLPGTYRPRRGSACGSQWKSGCQGADAGGASVGPPCPCGRIKRRKGAAAGRRRGKFAHKGTAVPHSPHRQPLFSRRLPLFFTCFSGAYCCRGPWKRGERSSMSSSRAVRAPPRPAGPYANVPRRRPAAATSSFTLPGTYRPRRGSTYGLRWKSGSHGRDLRFAMEKRKSRATPVGRVRGRHALVAK